MNEIHLPKPTKIKIENFSLYSNNLDFEYEFREGLNLIVGGNGIGKTTFINLIIFGFIGLYTSHKEHQRTYLGESKGYRRVRNKDYFSKRMLKDVDYNNKAKVTLDFEINGVHITTVRNIYTSQLEEVTYLNLGVKHTLNGKTIDDEKYSKEISKINKQEYLNFEYESLIEKYINIPFDGLIFFINNILLFDERRDTIFDNIDVQNNLFSKYFQEKNKDKLRQDFKDKATYHDSLSRQSSEKMKVINNLIKQFDNTEQSEKIIEIANLKLNEEQLKNNFNDNYKFLNETMYEISQLKSEKSKLQKELNQLEELEQEEKNKKLDTLFNSLHKNYNVYRLQIKDNCKCPMCNKNLKEDVLNRMLEAFERNDCFLCGSEISKEQPDVNINKFFKQIKSLSKQIKNIISLIVQKENDLRNSEKEKNQIENKLFELKKKINEEEYKNTNLNNKLDGLDIMQKQIKDLDLKKDEHKLESQKFKEKLRQVEREIENNKISNTQKLSKVFNEYAGAFTKLPCSLKYDDPKDNGGKRFIPVINGIDRLYADELSESQRFFIDHSFRMAILEAFKKSSSFYICETPDSSLDISYEDNASKVFLRYLNNNNVLILTSNFNNSNFIENIISEVNKVGFINLLDIGNPSIVQQQNSKLRELVNNIKEIVNDK